MPIIYTTGGWWAKCSPPAGSWYTSIYSLHHVLCIYCLPYSGFANLPSCRCL